MSKYIVVSQHFFKFFFLLVKIAQLWQYLILDKFAKFGVRYFVIIILINSGKVVLYLFDVLIKTQRRHETLYLVGFNGSTMVFICFFKYYLQFFLELFWEKILGFLIIGVLHSHSKFKRH